MSTGITLYHCWSARSFRALWTLEEMGLPYRLELLPFPPRVLKPEYLELNPLGTIPLLIDGETRMTESAAICEYLVTRYGPTALAVRVDEPGYGAYLNFLHQGEATLTFPQTLVLRYAQMEPEARRLPQAADDYAKWFLARLRMITAVLETSDYLAAGRFTAADISVGYALLLTRYTGLSEYLPPAVAAYWERLQSRPGFKAACEAEDRAADAAGVRRMKPAPRFALIPKA
jgi:glutathione S-transferase